MRSLAPLRHLLAAVLVLLLAGCEQLDDLKPSGDDERDDVVSGTVGNQPGQIAADFALPNTLNETVRLSDQLTGGATPADAVVLYFTMWCPICLSHSDHLLYAIVPQFASRGTTRYYLVDYVSGSVTASRASELANGYAGSALTTLVDVDQAVLEQFDAAMGSVVVIDASGTIHLNEDYRDGTALAAALDDILPAL